MMDILESVVTSGQHRSLALEALEKADQIREKPYPQKHEHDLNYYLRVAGIHATLAVSAVESEALAASAKAEAYATPETQRKHRWEFVRQATDNPQVGEFVQSNASSGGAIWEIEEVVPNGKFFRLKIRSLGTRGHREWRGAGRLNIVREKD